MEKLNNQIEIDKEILSVLPKNNKKNLKIYQDKASEIKNNYEEYLEDILSEIKRRVFKITSIKPDPEIEKLTQEVKEKSEITKFNKNVSSFEKMQLDEYLFVLKRFYKNNLELVNEAIVKCIEEFQFAGISISSEDFNYSVYAKEYMKIFLQEYKKGDVNSNKVKEAFEQIYWKCSDLIMHIEIGFRSLYLNNEKLIDKYFENKPQIMADGIEVTEEEAVNSYKALQNRLINLQNTDTGTIIQKFLDGVENTKDYEDATIEKAYKKLIEEDFNSLDDTQKEEINKNIYRLYNSLKEYKSFLKFKFIFDEVLLIYKSTDKYKNLYNEKLKNIKTLEGKLLQANRKTERFGRHRGLLFKIFNKSNKKLEKINLNINSKMNELKDLYRELEANKVKDIISTELNENSTIYDALVLIKPFYSFLVDVIIKKYEDIVQDSIKDMINEFRQFIEDPNITIINNIEMLEDRDMALIVKDKYNLCNINLTKEDLDEENIDGLISTVERICCYNYLKNSRTNIEDIKFVLQANKILEAK